MGKYLTLKPYYVICNYICKYMSDTMISMEFLKVMYRYTIAGQVTRLRDCNHAYNMECHATGHRGQRN